MKQLRLNTQINLCNHLLAFIFASKWLRIYMEIRRDVFQAIADPTRREIIGILAEKTLNLNAIADQFQVSRQAVSLHIKILNECGLIMITQKGRERYCEAKLERLDEVAGWVEQSKKLWGRRFNALEHLLDDLQTNATSKSRLKRKSKLQPKKKTK